MTKKVKIGGVTIGGGEKIAIQSMSTERLCNIEKSVRAVLDLKKAEPKANITPTFAHKTSAPAKART